MLSDGQETFNRTFYLLPSIHFLSLWCHSFTEHKRCYPKPPDTGGILAHAQAVDTRPTKCGLGSRLPYTRQLSGNLLPTNIIIKATNYLVYVTNCLQSVVCNLLPEIDPWSTTDNRLPERSKDLLSFIVILNHTTYAVIIIETAICEWQRYSELLILY